MNSIQIAKTRRPVTHIPAMNAPRRLVCTTDEGYDIWFDPSGPEYEVWKDNALWQFADTFTEALELAHE